MASDINRRRFLTGSFLVGAATGVGAAYSAYKIQRYVDPLANEAQAKRSFAQAGEDLVVQHIFETLEIAKPTYLDIGAGDPIDGNNTYLLYQQGSRGVLVEPNPEHTKGLKRARPQDTVLVCGIGPTEETEADYYLIGGAGGHALNTFSRAEADAVTARSEGQFYIKDVIKMPLVSINRVIEEELGAAPHFLSVDTEGLDLPILRALDFTRYRPVVICAETLVVLTGAQQEDILEFMASQDYAVRGGSFANTIFVDRRVLN